jgi:hypothetical protein
MKNACSGADTALSIFSAHFSASFFSKRSTQPT